MMHKPVYEEGQVVPQTNLVIAVSWHPPIYLLRKPVHHTTPLASQNACSLKSRNDDLQHAVRTSVEINYNQFKNEEETAGDLRMQ